MKIRLLFLFFFIAITVYSQVDLTNENHPVNIQTEWIQDSIGARLIVQFNIQEDWMIYDSVSTLNGPIPMEFNWSETALSCLQKAEKPVLNKKFDELFDMDIYYVTGTVKYVFWFQKQIKEVVQLEGGVEYMCCNLKSGICLPPATESFSLRFK